MPKIQVGDLYRLCKMMLDNDWGYIMGTAGILWTAARQKKTSNEMAIQYGDQWIGHMVTDCSGVMVYIWKQYGLTIDHGSNSIARKFVGKITKTPQPGYAAFMWKDKDTDKYPDGRGDFSHIGIVDENCKFVYESKGTKAGFKHDRPVSEWMYFAPFKDVEYKKIEEMTYMDPYFAVVTGDKVRVRTGPGTTYKMITPDAYLAKGTKIRVLAVSGKWVYAETAYGSGYVYSEYVGQAEDDDDTITGVVVEMAKDDLVAVCDILSELIAGIRDACANNDSLILKIGE